MPLIDIALVCDGTSDICVQDIIQWIVDSQFPDFSFRIQPAREVIPAHAPLHIRIKKAFDLYDPKIIVCHRDAEGLQLDERVREIHGATAEAALPIPVVPTIPVRMIESWLLIEESAIRSAANNRNGRQALNLPDHARIEGIANPKSLLLTALRAASGLPPQRLRKFDEHHARSRITGFVSSFEPLRRQGGFVRFENDLVAAVRAVAPLQ